MPHRIIGQCSHADFAGIEHLASIVDSAEMLDLSTLTSRQKHAFIFAGMAIRRGISWGLMRKVVREVLFWGEGDQQVVGVEIKFKAPGKETREFRRLWDSAP